MCDYALHHGVNTLWNLMSLLQSGTCISGNTIFTWNIKELKQILPIKSICLLQDSLEMQKNKWYMFMNGKFCIWKTLKFFSITFIWKWNEASSSCLAGFQWFNIGTWPTEGRGLKNFFLSVFTFDNGSSINFGNMQDHILPNIVNFEPLKVHYAQKSLPNKVSAGPDGLPAFLLKLLTIGIAEPLSIIFACSFEIGKLPDEWKFANVVLIFKN